MDDRAATFRFGYFRCLFLAAGRPLWGWAILHKAITAIEVDMLYALIAAAHRTGTGVDLLGYCPDTLRLAFGAAAAFGAGHGPWKP